MRRCFLLITTLAAISSLTCAKSEDFNKDTPKFIDVASQAGIDFKHATGSSGRFYYVEIFSGGGAFCDYDNDGDLDIYLVNGAELPGCTYKVKPTNRLYRNNGDGTFTDVTEIAGVGDTGYGTGCVWGDYDNDGDQDLYVANFGPNVLYRNNGDGTFTDVTEIAGVGDSLWSFNPVFLDYDNDGDLDLLSINYVDFTLENNKICYVGRFRDYCEPGQYNCLPNHLYRNNGDGTFTDVSKESGIYNFKGKGMGVVIGDYDNDGDMDIFVANDRVPGFLYRNNGDGTFTDVAVEAGVAYNEDGLAMSGMGCDMGDYDNDGDMDIFVTHFTFEVNSMFRNEGNGFFVYASFLTGLGKPSLLHSGVGTGFFDYDNDGDLDIFVANGNFIMFVHEKWDMLHFKEKNQLYRNNGDGSFTDISSEAGPGLDIARVHRAAAFGDYDNDGDIDILVTAWNDRPELLRNDGGNRNNWIMIKTIGTRSNRDGIGARVKLVAGSLTQIKDVRTAGGYLADHDRRLHFGLGKREKIDLIQIRWPSGIVDEIRDVKVNQLLIVKEGVGILNQLALEN